MREIKSTEKPVFEIAYHLKSGTGTIDAAQFLNYYTVEIYLEKQGLRFGGPIGKGSFYNILIEQIYNEEYSLFEVFDWSQNLLELGTTIFDFESGELVEELEPHFEEAVGCNILYLEELEILQEYRNIGLGKKVIRDVCLRFSMGCQMVVLESFPFQFMGRRSMEAELETMWGQQMRYGLLERDLEKASFNLFAYFQKLGFKNYLRNKYFFYNPIHINQKMKEVKV